jgi:major membrane immunogen (membrane-anchored lipoprotein)
MNTPSKRSEKIARLNDRARAAMGLACRLVQTAGISALPSRDQSKIREKVETFNAFTPDDDPYGEHDFGAFDHRGEKIFWKIDYYNKDLRFGSEDPADASKTTRVLTIMLAKEY